MSVMRNAVAAIRQANGIAVQARLMSSMPQAYRKYKSNADIENELSIPKPAPVVTPELVRLRATGGLRMWELASQESGNILTPALISNLRRRIATIEDNDTVNTGVFFSTDYLREDKDDGAIDIFCKGLDFAALKSDKKSYLRDVQTLAGKIFSVSDKKNLITVYGGQFNGTGFAVFAGSKFKLSTTQTVMIVNELQEGYFPIGGLPYYFIKGNASYGLEFARYAGACGACFSPSEMYALGLLTHVCEEDAQEAIFQTFTRSRPINLFSQVQELEVFDDILVTLLQQMHVGSSLNLLDDPLWNKMMIVPPQEVRLADGDTVAKEGTVSDIAEIVKHCFSTDDASLALHKLKSESGAFPTLAKAHATFAKTNKKLVQDWFDFTRKTEKLGLVKTLEAEVKYYVKK